MNLRIEKAAPENIPNIIALIKEFAGFEKLSEFCEVSKKDLHEAIFGVNAFVQCLAMFADETCIGYAIFYPVFKSFRGEPSMFLEDLYVSPEMRGRGFGLKMLKEVARISGEQGFVRMDWQALKWNAPALKFYETIGAESDDENFDFRLRGENFEKLAA